MATLYDQFGREIKVGKRPEEREISSITIRDRWSGYPSAGLSPERLAQIFKEADLGEVTRQAELFEEMEEKDTHLICELQTRKNAVHGLDYEIAAWSDEKEDKKISEFVADCLFNLDSFDDALLDLLDAVGKGFALTEILWDVVSNRAIVKDLSWIHQKKAVFYSRDVSPWQKSFEMPQIQTEAEPIYGEIMPPFKLVYHRYKARSGYDTRAGILRVCAWMYLFKNYAIKDWMSFAEVFGMPLRLGKYDPGASAEDRAALISAIRSLGADAAGVISKNTEIEFVQAVTNAGSNGIHESLARFCDAQMSKAILGQIATTEGTPGRLGSDDAQDKVRYDLIKSDAEALAKTIRYQIIRPLVGYNFGWDKPLPWFNIFCERPEDLEKLMNVYEGAANMGQPISQEHVSERFKIPLPKEGETLLQPPSQTGPYMFSTLRNGGQTTPSGFAVHPSNGGEFPIVASRRKPFTKNQAVIETFADGVFAAGQAALQQNEEAIIAAIAGAESFEDAIRNVLGLYPDMDAAALNDLAERAFLNADAFGRTVAEESAYE